MQHNYGANNVDKEAAGKRKATLATSAGASNVQNWAANKAVHYNEWANFGKKDFMPVVAAFKELLECCVTKPATSGRTLPRATRPPLCAAVATRSISTYRIRD
jgi:hypothetical protein